jgi:CRISPR-associated protein Cas2
VPFAVVATSAVPDHLRGYIGRFMVEPSPGLFVGIVSPRVCEALWGKVILAAGEGSATLIASDSEAEQGFRVLIHNGGIRRVVNLDNLELVATRTKPQVS